MSPNLHRAESTPEWHDVPHELQNRFQKLARKTSGLATPGNIITLIGGLIVMIAVILGLQGGEVTLPILCLIAVGRALDILDGHVANATKTKSPLGESFDATVDKFAVGFVLVLYLVTQSAPIWFLVFLLVQNLCNSIISLLGKKQSNTIHPTLAGKFSVAISWLALIVFPLSISDVPGYILAVISIILGIVATTQYYTQLRKKHV